MEKPREIIVKVKYDGSSNPGMRSRGLIARDTSTNAYLWLPESSVKRDEQTLSGREASEHVAAALLELIAPGRNMWLGWDRSTDTLDAFTVFGV